MLCVTCEGDTHLAWDAGRYIAQRAFNSGELNTRHGIVVMVSFGVAKEVCNMQLYKCGKLLWSVFRGIYENAYIWE